MSQLAIIKEPGDSFFEVADRLLGYTVKIKYFKPIQLLIDTLNIIQSHSEIFLTTNLEVVRKLYNLLRKQNLPDEVYIQILHLLNNGFGTTTSKIPEFIDTHLNNPDQKIFHSNNLDLNLELIEHYILLNKKKWQGFFDSLMIDWKRFDDQVTKENFEKLIWLGFFKGNPTIIKEKLGKYNELVKIEDWNIKFYHYINKRLSGLVKIDQDKVQKSITMFIKKGPFTLETNKKISKTIQDRLNVTIKQIEQQKKANRENPINIILKSIRRYSPDNLPSGVQYNEINLDEKIKIGLTIFKDKELSTIAKHILIDAITDSNQEYFFLTKKMITNIKKVIGPQYYFCLIDSDGKKAIEGISEHPTPSPKKMKSVIAAGNKSKKTSTFTWPTTEVYGKSSNFESDLNEKSDLRKMGYQITDMTRSERWRVLQRAIPKLGLKKVSNTIANNIRLKKGQKNGPKKFRYAITEWEYDLSWLKKVYYKNNFPWPKD